MKQRLHEETFKHIEFTIQDKSKILNEIKKQKEQNKTHVNPIVINLLTIAVFSVFIIFVVNNALTTNTSTKEEKNLASTLDNIQERDSILPIVLQKMDLFANSLKNSDYSKMNTIIKDYQKIENGEILYGVNDEMKSFPLKSNYTTIDFITILEYKATGKNILEMTIQLSFQNERNNTIKLEFEKTDENDWIISNLTAL